MTKLTKDQEKLIGMLKERGVIKDDFTVDQQLQVLKALQTKDEKGMYIAVAPDKDGNAVLVTKAGTENFDAAPGISTAAAITTMAANGAGASPFGGKVLGMSHPGTWFRGSAARVVEETTATTVGGYSLRALSGTGVVAGVVESWGDMKTGYHAIGNDGRQVLKSSINVTGAVGGGVAGAAAGAGILSAFTAGATAGAAAGTVGFPVVGTIIGAIVVGGCAAAGAYFMHKSSQTLSNQMLGETMTEKADKMAYAAAMGKLDAPRAVAVDSALAQVIIAQRQDEANKKAIQAGLAGTGAVASATQSIIPPGAIAAAKSRAPGV